MSKIYEALEMAGQMARGRSAPSEAPPRSVEPAEVRQSREFVPAVQRLIESPVEAPFALHLEHTMTALYNNILSLLPKSNSRVIEFIAPHRGCGTSTLIREFAKVVAVKLKKSVLLLDADAHAPTQVREFKLSQDQGWDAVMDRRERMESLLRPIEGSKLTVSQLLVDQSNQPLLFESSQFKGMLSRLKESFDLILIDSPPAKDYADGLVLAPKVDGVVLVVSSEDTRWQVVDDVRRRLDMMGGNILGTVLNNQRFHIPKAIYDRL